MIHRFRFVSSHFSTVTIEPDSGRTTARRCHTKFVTLRGACENQRVRVSILGTFEVHGGAGQTVPLGNRRMPVLLARLALTPQKAVAADVLLEDLWSGHPPDGGRQTLRRLVARTRERLGEHGLTIGPYAEGGGYVLDLSPQAVDVHLFEQRAAEGARLLSAGAADRALTALNEALSMWRGALLGGIDADFAERERVRLESLRLRAVEDRLHALADTGETSSILPELYDLCREHPTRERTHSLLIRTLARDGQTAAALSAYEQVRKTLADELGTDPSPELRRLHERLLRGEVAPRARWTNPYLTRFFGRERELTMLTDLMSRSRLVTLVGPGGVGKTRLATEYACQFDTERVCFVDLSLLRDDDNLADAIASQVGVSDSAIAGAGGDRLMRLIAALSTTPTLLLLDTCEHLAASVAELTDRVLSVCPQVRILATTREPLGVAGEAVLRVDPLDASHAHGEAVVMFHDLATLARPGLHLTPSDEESMIEICRRLDGLPLAIELAATRVRSMSIQEIAQRLDERFRLLDGTRRSGDRRHQTLIALLDWTWNLLSEPEQRLTARLSLLPGGITEASATALLQSDETDAGETQYLLSSLVDKSLLHRTDDPLGGPTRYRLLETPRLYLADRLRATGDETAAIEVADRYFTALATAASTLILGRDQRRALLILDSERDNLIASLRRMLHRDDHIGAARLGTSLGYYWLIRGRYDDLERWTAALDGAHDGLDPSTRNVIAAIRAVLPRQNSTNSSPISPMLPLDDEALTVFPPLVSIATKAHLSLGDHERARIDATVAVNHPDPWLHAAGIAAEALIDEASGDVERAEKGIAHALKLFQEVGDVWSAAQMAVLLTGFQSLHGDANGAISNLRTALDLQHSLDLHEAVPVTLVRLGKELLRAEQPETAKIVFQEALATTPPSNDVRLLCMVGLARIALDNGDAYRGTALLTDARALLTTPLADPDYLTVVLLGQEASLALQQDDVKRARELAEQAWHAAAQLGDAGTQAEVAELLADTLFHAEEFEGAARMLGAATGLRGLRDDGNPRVRAMTSMLIASLGSATYERTYRSGEEYPVPLTA